MGPRVYCWLSRLRMRDVELWWCIVIFLNKLRHHYINRGSHIYVKFRIDKIWWMKLIPLVVIKCSAIYVKDFILLINKCWYSRNYLWPCFVITICCVCVSILCLRNEERYHIYAYAHHIFEIHCLWHNKWTSCNHKQLMRTDVESHQVVISP